MIPEEMVPDLDLCKHEAIRKLFAGKTYFNWWINETDSGKPVHEVASVLGKPAFHIAKYPAPTTSEMGEVLPKKHYPVSCLWECGDGYCYWTDCENIEHTVEDKKEANNRAEMVNWLWENKYLRV